MDVTRSLIHPLTCPIHRFAIACRYLLPKLPEQKVGDEDDDAIAVEATDSSPKRKGGKGGAKAKGADAGAGEGEGDAAKALLERIAPLSHDAMTSSILCVCETSGGVSPAGLMVCQGCGHKVCRQCEPYFHLAVHSMTSLNGTSDRTLPNSEVDPGSFERKLRQVAPLSMVLESGASDGPLAKADGAEGLAGRDFKLVSVTRRHGCWDLQYGAAANTTDDRLMYELRVTVGQLATGHLQKLGAMAQVSG